MKVILTDELRGKGGEGDIVDVAQGYAENFLFPNKMALPATPGNIKQLEERRHNIEKREAERVAAAEALKASIDGKSVTVDAKIGEEGQLFGSVTPAQIAEAIKAELGVEVDRKRGRKARQSYQYVDILTGMVELFDAETKEPIFGKFMDDETEESAAASALEMLLSDDLEDDSDDDL